MEENISVTTDIVNDGPTTTVSNTRSWKDFAALINGTWRKGAEALIQTGRYIREASEELDRDEFEALLRLRLDFEASVGRKLKRIGENKVLCAHVHKLPPCWSILYELSKLEDGALEAAIADGRINPKMMRKDAIALRESDAAEEPDGAHDGGDPDHDGDPGGVDQDHDDDDRAGAAEKPDDADEDHAAGDGDPAEKPDDADEDHDGDGRAGAAPAPSEPAPDPATVAATAVNELTPDQLQSFLDQLLPERKVDLEQKFSTRTNTDAEIWKLAAECAACLMGDEVNEAPIQKKMARIKTLTAAPKSKAKLDRDAFPRGMGFAGLPGEKFSTMNMTSDGVDESGTQSYGLPPAGRSRTH